ncbi:MAG: Acylamino-acid-releasing enzyme [Candidatus Heimdallarchaeota archaeon LC_2]|nr:MAG: Acylamino-acid-releasing enzyme [Candidatus Heimdallarchaeota archaeon LC_2]
MFSVEHEDHMSLGLLQLNDDIEKSWSTRIPITENFLYDASFHPMNGSILVHTWSYPNMSWNGSKIELLIPTNKNYEQITRKVVAGSESIATSQPKFSPDGRKMTFFSEQTGWLNLWIANSDGSDPQPLVDEKCEHAYSTWVTGGSSHTWIGNDRVVFTRNRDGFFSLNIVDINSKVVNQLLLAEGGYTTLSSSKKHVVCFFSDYKTRGQIWLIDLNKLLEGGNFNDSVKIIANSGVRLSNDILEKFTPPKKISFPTSDGQEAHGLLYVQKDNNGETKNAPLIIEVHGGPTGMKTNTFSLGAQYYASRGYAFFQVNHRGSIGYGREYREILNGNWGIYDVNDSVDALNYLEKEGIADKNKVIILGGSAGGFTVLMALAKKPGIFTAGVDLFGVSDNFLLAEETHYLEAHYSDSLVGILPEDSAKYFELSPIFHAENIVDPLIILQGEDDPVVLKNQSELIRDKVKGPVEYKVYQGEGHGFKKRATLKDMYNRIDKFLKNYVLYSKPK